MRRRCFRCASRRRLREAVGAVRSGPSGSVEGLALAHGRSGLGAGKARTMIMNRFIDPPAGRRFCGPVTLFQKFVSRTGGKLYFIGLGRSQMQAALRTHTENEHEQPWMVLKRSPIRKKLAFLVLFIRHVPALLPLLLALREDNVRRLVLARPEIFWILLTSQVAANWD